MGKQPGRSPALVDYTEEENDYGVVIPCVYAACLAGDGPGDSVGPIWGDGEDSIKRALATLTAECSCGARWHYEKGGENSDDDDIPF
jgi:hypothetical protein